MLHAGDYTISSPLDVQNGQTLTLQAGARLLQATSNDDDQRILSIVDKADVTIRGGAIIGDLDSSADTEAEHCFGIFISGGSNITVESVQVEKFRGDGMYITRNADTPENITVRSVTSNDNRRHGIGVVAVDGLILDAPVCTGNGLAGVDLEVNTDETINDVTIRNGTLNDNENGLQLDARTAPNLPEYITNVDVSDTTMNDNTNWGFVATRGTGVTLDSCEATGNGSNGAYMDRPNTFHLKDCDFESNDGDFDVVFTRTGEPDDTARIAGNVIENCDGTVDIYENMPEGSVTVL